MMGIAELKDKLATRGVDLRFANVRSEIHEIMRRAGLEEAIGADHFYISLDDAVKAYLSEQAEQNEAEISDEPREEDGVRSSDAPAEDDPPKG